MQPDLTLPLVTVVVVTYNSAAFVVETLESVRLQTYPQIELIITDDCSADDTCAVVQSWLEQHQARFAGVKLVTAERNSGIAANCNRGLRAATGEWFKLIAGDDALEHDLIDTYINHLARHGDIAIISGNFQAYVDRFEPAQAMPVTNLAAHRFNRPGITAKEQFEILLRKNCVSAPSVMINTKLLRHVGGFDESLNFMEDWPMWLLLTKAGYKIHFLDIVAAKYRIHQRSINSGKHVRLYKSRVELAIDRMYEKKYLPFLPLPERMARKVIVYRNALLIRMFGNRRTPLSSLLSKVIGFAPVLLLQRYRKRYAGEV